MLKYSKITVCCQNLGGGCPSCPFSVYGPVKCGRCRAMQKRPRKKCINFFLSPIIFHQPIFAMYNNEPWKLPVAHTWGPWQSKQSYETSWLSVWDSAAKPDSDFGLTRSTLPDFRVQSGRVGTSGCKNGLDRVDLKKGPKLDSTQR